MKNLIRSKQFKLLTLATLLGSVTFTTTNKHVSADEPSKPADTVTTELPGLEFLSHISKLSVKESKSEAQARITFDRMKALLEAENARIQAEMTAKLEAEKAAQEKAAQEAARLEAEKAAQEAQANTIQFGPDGLLVMTASSRAQNVVNLLLGIPGDPARGIPQHSNGAYYHASTGLDSYIDELSTSEALWVLWRIEGAGFGQTGDGYAGYDTPASHQAVVTNQINRRFGGSIHALLKAWGTFSYGGY